MLQNFFKTVILSAIVMIVFSCFDLQAQCPPNDPCKWSDWENDTLSMTLPGYDSCWIKFDYRYRICTYPDGTEKFEYEIWGFTDPQDTINCKELLTNLSHPNGDPNWEFIDWVFNQANVVFPRVVFVKEYENAQPWNKKLYECPNIVRRYSNTYSSCTKYAVFIDDHSPFPFPRFRIKTYPCNDVICCELMQELCIDPITKQLVIKKKSFNYLSGQCESNPEPIPFAIWTSRCFQRCYPE